MKKLLTSLLLSVALLVPTITVAEPEVQTTVLSTMDIRRSPTAAPLMHRTNDLSHDYKEIRFTFYTGDLFKYNPHAHGYLMTDGYIDSSEPKKSLQGRGITIGKVPKCDGVGFEQFGVNSGFAEGCIPIKFKDNSFYDFYVRTGVDGVWVKVLGPEGLDEVSMLEFSGDYPSFDTVFGVALDKKPSTYGFFNMVQVLK